MGLVFDIETDDLKASKIWCLVCQDSDSGEIYKFAPHQLESGLDLLQSADTLIGHNILGFDIPVIKKLYGVDLSDKKTWDTLVMSRLFNPVRAGGHGLEIWGHRLGFTKGTFKDFETYSKEMLDYCVRDVQLNTLVYKQLQKEAKGFSEGSVLLEHEVSKITKQQEDNGFLFASYAAEMLLAELREKMQSTEDEVHKSFKPKLVDDKEVTPYIKKDGTLSKRGLTDEEFKKVESSKNYNPFMRRKLKEFNLGSRVQIGEWLQDFGWKPDVFTETGRPRVDDRVLRKVKGIPEAELIAEFLTLQKVTAMIDSWLGFVEDDDRVHGYVLPIGAITTRMSMRNPNVQQVPSVRSPYGKECRSCWIVPKGYKLCGVDASALEARLLAHYMEDEDFTNEIINGDIHARNQEAAGLQSRDQAKTLLYACIYGSGNAKLGRLVGGSEEDGKRIKELFYANNRKFKSLRDRVAKATAKGYLKGLDGRRLYITKRHAALNSLLQGGGSIVMKRGLVILNDKALEKGLDFKFVANIHDEWQVEVREDHAETFGALAVQSIIDAGEYYNMKCPLDGEYKIGDNWSETH